MYVSIYLHGKPISYYSITRVGDNTNVVYYYPWGTMVVLPVTTHSERHPELDTSNRTRGFERPARYKGPNKIHEALDRLTATVNELATRLDKLK